MARLAIAVVVLESACVAVNALTFEEYADKIGFSHPAGTDYGAVHDKSWTPDLDKDGGVVPRNVTEHGHPLTIESGNRKLLQDYLWSFYYPNYGVSCWAGTVWDYSYGFDRNGIRWTGNCDEWNGCWTVLQGVYDNHCSACCDGNTFNWQCWQYWGPNGHCTWEANWNSDGQGCDQSVINELFNDKGYVCNNQAWSTFYY